MNKTYIQHIFYYLLIYSLIFIDTNIQCSPSISATLNTIAQTPMKITQLVKTTKDIVIIVGTISAISIIYKAGLIKYTWDILKSPTRIAEINKRTEAIQKAQTAHSAQLTTIQERLEAQRELLDTLLARMSHIDTNLNEHRADFERFKILTNIHHDDITRIINDLRTNLEIRFNALDEKNSQLQDLIREQIATIIPKILALLLQNTPARAAQSSKPIQSTPAAARAATPEQKSVPPSRSPQSTTVTTAEPS